MVTLGELVIILDLARQGLSVSAIARRTGLDRKTIRKYIAKGLEPPAYTPRPPRQTLVGPYEPYLRERLQTFPELSARRLLRDIRALGYQGGYTVLKDFLRTVRPKPKVQFERRFETPAGKQAQVDFAQFRVEFTDEPGVVRILWLFTIILGPQPLDLGPVLRHAGSADRPALPHRRLRRHGRRAVRAALRPHEDGGDRRGRQRRRSQYNASLVALLNHYGAMPRACRPYRAKTKGKIERPYRYVRQDFWLARSFRNLDDLNAQFDDWRTQIANPRVHATTRRVVDQHFAEERPALIAHPAIPYSAVLTIERRVSREGMVSVGGNLYSVPDTARKRVLDVQNHPSEVRIFEDGALIAAHPVLEGKNQRRVDPAHRKAPPPAEPRAGPPPTRRRRQAAQLLRRRRRAGWPAKAPRDDPDARPHPRQPRRPAHALRAGGARTHHAPARARRDRRARGHRRAPGRRARHPRDPPHRRLAEDGQADAAEDAGELRLHLPALPRPQPHHGAGPARLRRPRRGRPFPRAAWHRQNRTSPPRSASPR